MRLRLHRLRFDIWLCLLLAYLVSLGTGAAASALSAATYDDYAADHVAVEGEPGSLAGEDVPRAQSVEDLLELDTFTILSEGIAYRNEGAGFYQGRYLYNLALPSGERVAAQINLENVQTGEDYYSGEVILPLGRVVWADLDRTDFYVDMTGNTARYSQEERTENHVLVVQGITILACFPLLHALGSHFGLFPAFFPSRRREGAV